MGGPVQQSTFVGTAGAAIVALVISLLNQYAHAGIDAGTATTITTIVTMLLVHFVPDTGATPPAPK